MEVAATEGHEFDFSAMFDRVDHPARGRQGGGDGAPTIVRRGDGSAMQGKGKQFVPHGGRVQLFFPGGAGYGKVHDRDKALILRDLARGYISEESALNDYGLSQTEIDEFISAIEVGDTKFGSTLGNE